MPHTHQHPSPPLQNLANMAWSLATMTHTPPPMQNLANMAWSLATLGHRSSQTFLDALVVASLPQLPQFNEQVSGSCGGLLTRVCGGAAGMWVWRCRWHVGVEALLACGCGGAAGTWVWRC